MRNSVKGLVVCVFLLALVVGFGVIQAQDTSSSAGTGTVQCSSDLISQLYVAERYFDFGKLNDQRMQNGSSTLDLSQFDYGQYSSLFNNWSAISSAQAPLWSPDQQNTVSNMMSMDQSTFENEVNSMQPSGMDMSTMSNLAPSFVTDEPAECSTLRSELDRFFQVVAFQDLNPNNTFGQSSGTEMTPEATVETSG